LLYGDSNAAHYVGVITELAQAAGVSFRNYAHSGCVPIGSDPTPFMSSRRLKTCLISHQVVARDLSKYDVVFIGAAWDNYNRVGERRGANLAKELEKFVASLTARGVRVVLLDTVPEQPNIDARCGRK